MKQRNPKKAGSKSWRRYEAYKAATSYAQYRQLGGLSGDYTYDLGKGFIIELDD